MVDAVEARYYSEGIHERGMVLGSAKIRSIGLGN